MSLVRKGAKLRCLCEEPLACDTELWLVNSGGDGCGGDRRLLTLSAGKHSFPPQKESILSICEVEVKMKAINLFQDTNEKKQNPDERHGWKSALKMPREPE